MISLFALAAVGSALALAASRVLNANTGLLTPDSATPSTAAGATLNADASPLDGDGPDRYLIASGFSFSLAAGGLVFPPLTLLSLPGAVYVGIPLWRSAWRSVTRDRRVDMSCVDAVILPVGVLTGHTAATMFGYVVFFASRRLLMRTRTRSRDRLLSVFDTDHGSVVRLNADGVAVTVPIEALVAGDSVVCSAGSVVLVDGIVREGHALIDQHTLTGESQPVDKLPGDVAFASTVVIEGRIVIEVRRAGRETVAGRVAESLAGSVDFTSRVQLRGEAMANAAALPLLTMTAVALPIVGASSALAILFAPVLNAIRLGVPISVLNHLRLATDAGVLVRDGRVLELLGDVDTFVFDKTGTLTTERMVLADVHTCGDLGPDRVVALAAAAERGQSHPLAQAILDAADARGLTVPGVERARYVPGHGLEVESEGTILRLGSARFMEQAGFTLPAALDTARASAEDQGASLVYLAADDRVVAGLELHPVVRPEAARTVAALQSRGARVLIMSGDHRSPTDWLARRLGVDDAFAEVLPGEKASLVEALQQQGRVVCFVGDGINDTIALRTAHVSISLSGATTIATDCAQVVLLDGRLDQVLDLIDITDSYGSNMKGTLAAALIPSGLCIGGALLGSVGIISAVGFFVVSVGAGVLNASRPELARRAKRDRPPG